METKEIHVGNLVKSVVIQRGYSLSEIAKKIGISRQTFNSWLNKSDIGVKDLFTISKAVGYDFVNDFCVGETIEHKLKFVLQIEIEENKINDVLKALENKQLYNIIKRPTE